MGPLGLPGPVKCDCDMYQQSPLRDFADKEGRSTGKAVDEMSSSYNGKMQFQVVSIKK